MSEAVVVLTGVITHANVPALCAGLRDRLVLDGANLVVCDVGGLVRPDAVAIEGVARLQLTARRAGSRLVLRHASRELQSLLALAGLSDVVPVGPGSAPVPSREVEHGEQARVEEVRDADDPAV